MGEQQYTPEGMPLVTKEVSVALLRDYVQRQREEGLTQYKDACMGRIITENPELESFLSATLDGLSEAGANEQAQRAYVEGFRNAYELLRRQAESNQLDQSLGSPAAVSMHDHTR